MKKRKHNKLEGGRALCRFREGAHKETVHEEIRFDHTVKNTPLLGVGNPLRRVGVILFKNEEQALHGRFMCT